MRLIGAVVGLLVKLDNEKFSGKLVSEYCDNPLPLLLNIRSETLLPLLLTLLPLATALLPRPTGVGGVSLRLTSVGVGE